MRRPKGGAPVATVFAWLGLCGAAIAQVGSPQPLPRDEANPTIGTAIVSGVVTIADPSARPLRRVAVTLTPAPLGTPQSTVTDDAGQFEFTGVTAGNYTLAADRSGYVPTQYGATRPGAIEGEVLAVADGQQMSGLSIRMPRGAVISGTIRRESGSPAVGVNVLVNPVETVRGERRTALTAALFTPTTTDDQGAYRVFGLAAGEYVVEVQPVAPARDASEFRRLLPAEIEWADALTSSHVLTPAPAPGPIVEYAPVYFPGTPVASDASIVTLGAGEERTDINFATLLVPTARIEGVVLDPSGAPSEGVRLSLESTAGGDSGNLIDMIATLIGQGQVRTMPNGRFTIDRVMPGHYTLSARGVPHVAGEPTNTSGQGALGALSLLSAGGDRATLWASQDIAVDGADISQVTLQLQPGMNVSGRVVYEATTHPVPTDLTRTQVTLMTVPSTASPLAALTTLANGLSSATVAADGTFTIKGVTPNAYRASVFAPGVFSVAGLPGAIWALKSVRLDNRDVADLAFPVRPSEDVTGLTITLTDRLTVLSGSLVDQLGRPAPNIPIVVFPTDRAYWLPQSRRIQEMKPASDGAFHVSGLPAGEYYLAAVAEVDPTELYEPAFLEQLVPGALKVTLADGEVRTQNLKVGGS